MHSNFDFLTTEFPDLHTYAKRAEAYAARDPRASAIYARMTLEATLIWIYDHDKRLSAPYDTALGALLHEARFREVVPQAVFQKARVIQKAGNQAVHETRKPVMQWTAQNNINELFHILYWVARTYHRKPLETVGSFDLELLKKESVSPLKVKAQENKIKELETQLSTQAKALKEAEETALVEREEKQTLVEQARERNEVAKDTHDYCEAETRTYLIDLELALAGWDLENKEDREYPVTSMPNKSGDGFVDYVLWGKNGKPLGLVEAKRTTHDAREGQQQAKLYADCLEQMHGQRPVIYYTNGYEIFLWDDATYPPRKVAGYHNEDELALMIQRRTTRKSPEVSDINNDIVDRYYQKRAIKKVAEEFESKQRKCLLVMATGTGKTRTAIALVDLLQRYGWVKRALFLADRISLVKQAVGSFKTNFPDSNPVNLCEEKTQDGRVYACTYQTMMGFLDSTKKGGVRFGCGYFDLLIIDEAHRSVYQKYSHIFRYFDSLLLGLTATPQDQVDRNTYNLFELETGVPTDAYELDTAVNDGYLVPPRAETITLRFPSEGIKYDDLNDEEKEEWESLDWGDGDSEEFVPAAVNAGAINKWLFNQNTVDHVLRKLMENGHKVDAGDKLAKTIIFARNHKHAAFIEERFNDNYPHYKGAFARVIDNQVKYPQTLIESFGKKDQDPQIAISVDMLDTGIDVPEAANLVFFKPVYSKTKFWQMIGRGTRPCENLFGPGEDKVDFKIFDFCGNFRYFNENPQGVENSGVLPLQSRLFNARVNLLRELQQDNEEAYSDLVQSLKDTLCKEVVSMPKENFIVKDHLKAVERFAKKESWGRITDDDMHSILTELSPLPRSLESENVLTKQFDMICLQLQSALQGGVRKKVEFYRNKIIFFAEQLEAIPNVPNIQKQLAFIQAIQRDEWWEGVGLVQVEEIRKKLRELAQFVEKKSQKVIYTNFEDEIIGVEEAAPIEIPRMTSLQYEKKVKEYINEHLNSVAIQKLYLNEALTSKDLESLKEILIQMGEDDGEQLLAHLLENKDAPSLPYFVRSLIGLDRNQAKQLFAKFLNDQSLSSNQMRFIELIIDQLTSRGVIEPGSLYNSPFIGIHSGGPEELFAGKENVVEGVFETLKNIKSKLLMDVS